MSTFVSNNVSSGAVVFASDHNEMGSRIAAVLNGGLDDNNIGSVSGTKIVPATIPSTALDSNLASGWQTLGHNPDTVTYNGNRSYSLVFNGVDITGTVSNGMRLKTTRSVAAPTQCTSLNGSTQYYSKSSPAGMTFTDDFTVSAWVKVSSYTLSTIASRYNGTSGWELEMAATGQILLIGYNASGTNYSLVQSYQSLPLNKWVHVTAQLDMSTFTATPTTSYVMFDGVDISATVVRNGTSPTALIQAGNLEIGSRNAGTLFFPGKIAQVAIFNAKVTQATMRGYISQGLAGTESSLISAYSFNNSINDLNANANNLTANGSAVATNADSPFSVNDAGAPTGTTDVAIITSKTFSTNTTLTVRVPTGCTIPTSGGVSAVSYSTQAAPYGFSDSMVSDCRRLVYIPMGASASTASTTSVQFNAVTNYSFTVPYGCSMLRFGLTNPSLSATSSGVGVIKFYNGAVNTTANELTQANNTTSNGYMFFDTPVPVVPGEVINLNLGWSTTAGTLTWSGGNASRQAPAIWVDAA